MRKKNQSCLAKSGISERKVSFRLHIAQGQSVVRNFILVSLEGEVLRI